MSQHPSQNYTHLHYHYHYYRPQSAQFSSSEVEHLSQEANTASKDASANLTGEQSSFSKWQNSTISGQKKRSCLHKSGVWSNGDRYADTIQIEKSTEIPEITSFTEYSESPVSQNQSPSPFRTLRSPNQSAVLGKLQIARIAKLQQEVQIWKRQVSRLKSIEEECIYLRKVCLQHYESCNP